MASNKQTRLANRYSKALVHAYVSASHLKAGEPVSADVAAKLKNAAHVLSEVAQAVGKDRETLLFFKNPTVALSVKEAIVKKVLASVNVQDSYINSFLSAVIQNGRFQYIVQIAEAFFSEVRDVLNVLMVKVTTAREISAQEQDELSKKIAAGSQRELEFSWAVDKNILGGLVLEYEGKRYDSSIRGKLNSLQENIRL